MIGFRSYPSSILLLLRSRSRSRNTFKKVYSTETPKKKLLNVFVDNKRVQVEEGSALIQACELAGVVVPRFCYHERLQVAGNCRMCLVEVEKAPKPIASCAYPVQQDGMKVYTQTPLVKKAREGILSFLLSNHPLDCPVCDQGGECDLQDQVMSYGSDRGRYKEVEGKRAVEDKNFGPLISTSMNRCIHCTRCVRFSNELAGYEGLGTSGRGNDMQIGMYLSNAADGGLNSEVSGNVVDLCPVGALTSKPYEFKARPWELKKTESVDVMDALGSNIRVDSRGNEVMRVLPRLNEEINEEWISDKTRYAYDGLKRQRLSVCLGRSGSNGELSQLTWKKALELFSQKLQSVPSSQGSGSKISVVAGKFTDLETLVAAKDLFSRLNCQSYFVDGRDYSSLADYRSNYLLNSGIPAPVQEGVDACLLIGTNPRHEAAIYNMRLRQGYLNNRMDIGLIGEHCPVNYDYEYLGKDLSSGIEKLIAGGSSGGLKFAKKFLEAKKPMVVIGSGVFESEGGDATAALYPLMEKLIKKVPKLVTEEWNGFNVLQRNASQVGCMDVGFVCGPKAVPLKDSKVVVLLGSDDFNENDIPNDAFVVYIGHHGEKGAELADLILPAAAYTEKSSTFVNTEGRPQITRTAVTPPFSAKEDWKIIRALSEVLGMTLPYDNVAELRERIAQISPSLVRYGSIEKSSLTKQGIQSVAALALKKGGSKPALKLPVTDFYLTDVISRSSKTMAQCSSAFSKGIAEQLEKRKQQAISA